MLVLGIDTSTKVGGLGLYHVDQGLVGEMNLMVDQTHSQRLMPMLEALLEASGYTTGDLDGIAVALGPGSFTGTRIGVTTAKTLAQVEDLPIVGISTLEVAAANLAYAPGVICPIFDARNRRVYSALFEGGGADEDAELSEVERYPFGMKRISEDDGSTIDELLDRLAAGRVMDELVGQMGPIYFVGDAVDKYQELIREKLGEQAILPWLSYRTPRGGLVAELGCAALRRGEGADLFALTPNYLKPAQAEIQWRQKHGK